MNSHVPLAVVVLLNCTAPRQGVDGSSISSSSTIDEKETTTDVATVASSFAPTQSGESASSSSGGATSFSTGGSEADTVGELYVPEKCSVLEADCPPGFKCLPFGPDKNDQGCFPVVSDPGDVGVRCSDLDYADGVIGMLDSCEASAICYEGTCEPQCQGLDRSCPDAFTCLDSAPLAVCVPRCDPLVDECGVGRLCILSAGYFTCFPQGGGYSLWEHCSFAYDCQPGLVCSAPSLASECQSDYCCNSLCELEVGDCPGAGQSCVPFFGEDTYPEYHKLGVCTI